MTRTRGPNGNRTATRPLVRLARRTIRGWITPCPGGTRVRKPQRRPRPTCPFTRPAARRRERRVQEVAHHVHPRRYQRLRSDRSPVAQGPHRACPGRRGGRRQRPRRCRDERAAVQARLDVRHLSRATFKPAIPRSSSTDARSRSSPNGTRPPCRGAISGSTSSSRAPASSPTRRRPARTSTRVRRRSSSAPRPRARTSRSSSASTRTATTREPTTSSATRAARRTASRRPPRSSTTS